MAQKKKRLHDYGTGLFSPERYTDESELLTRERNLDRSQTDKEFHDVGSEQYRAISTGVVALRLYVDRFNNDPAFSDMRDRLDILDSGMAGIRWGLSSLGQMVICIYPDSGSAEEFYDTMVNHQKHRALLEEVYESSRHVGGGAKRARTSHQGGLEYVRRMKMVDALSKCMYALDLQLTERLVKNRQTFAQRLQRDLDEGNLGPQLPGVVDVPKFIDGIQGYKVQVVEGLEAYSAYLSTLAPSKSLRWMALGHKALVDSCAIVDVGVDMVRLLSDPGPLDTVSLGGCFKSLNTHWVSRTKKMDQRRELESSAEIAFRQKEIDEFSPAQAVEFQNWVHRTGTWWDKLQAFDHQMGMLVSSLCEKRGFGP